MRACGALSRRSVGTRPLRRAGAMIAAAALVAALVGASSADATKVASKRPASTFIQKGIYDDAQILYGNPDKVFPSLAQLGTQLIRVNLWWGGPNGVARSMARERGEPGRSGVRLGDVRPHRTVCVRLQDGPDLHVVGTPSWANASAGWNAAPTEIADLQAFVTAAARRYSGPSSCRTARYPGRVRNGSPGTSRTTPSSSNPSTSAPTRTGYAEREGLRPDLQRRCGRAKSVNRTNSVACGVTAPRGNNQPGTIRSSVSPSRSSGR